jgi:hypothetical protein
LGADTRECRSWQGSFPFAAFTAPREAEQH